MANILSPSPSSPFVNFKAISGSGIHSLGIGSEIATTWCHIAFETGSQGGGWGSGSITVMKRMPGQSTPQPTYYTNFLNGNFQNSPITGSTQFYLENSCTEILIQVNGQGGVTGSIWWATVKN